MGIVRKIIVMTIGQKNAWRLRELIRPKELRELDKKRREFYLQFLENGSTYFDVGANFGNRILPIVKSGIKIIAIEPQKDCLEYLSTRYKNDIEIVPYGLGEKEGEQIFYIGDSNTLSTFSKNWIDAVSDSNRYGDNKWEKTEKIYLTTLDNLIVKYGRPDFIKIDVEGYELEVLKGLSSPVPVISFEYTVPEATDNALNCLELLNKLAKGKILCNYSIGESMKWAMEHWLNYEDMLKYIKSASFSDTKFGDIYVKSEVTGIPNNGNV